MQDVRFCVGRGTSPEHIEDSGLKILWGGAGRPPPPPPHPHLAMLPLLFFTMPHIASAIGPWQCTRLAGRVSPRKAYNGRHVPFLHMMFDANMHTPPPPSFCAVQPPQSLICVFACVHNYFCVCMCCIYFRYRSTTGGI